MYGGTCHKIDKALAMLFFELILKTLIVQEMMPDLFLISQRVYCKLSSCIQSRQNVIICKLF